MNVTYHFTFGGEESLKATVVIKNKTLDVLDGHVDTPDLHVRADTRTWLDFLAKECPDIHASLKPLIRAA